MSTKLLELESQLVRGGRNILDTYTERQSELQKKMEEIAERKKREVEMQQQLELQEETTIKIRETHTSVQQEVELKTRKLKKCYTSCKNPSFYFIYFTFITINSRAFDRH